jgi:sugar lactone lactonase YvrE
MRRWLKRIGLVLGAILAVLALYLTLWPVSIEPVAWTPPEAPKLEGVYATNSRLAKVRWIKAGGEGPEDVAVDAKGRLYTGIYGGRIVRISPDGSVEPFVATGGRPLGLDWDAAGNLIVADAHKGLLSVSPAGAIKTLVTGHDGVPFRVTDDVDVGPDGIYYFSDASSRFPVEQYVLDLLEHRPNGRLLAYDPRTGRTRLLLKDLYFANGVAVAPDASFVLVAETGAYAITRYWLKGAKAGTRETLIDNLPGFPDGVSTGSNGIYWVAIVSPRDPGVDSLLPSPFLRKVVVRLPDFMKPAPKRYGFVLGLDAGGRVVRNLQDPSPQSFSPITSVEESGGTLYLGTLSRTAVASLALSDTG